MGYTLYFNTGIRCKECKNNRQCFLPDFHTDNHVAWDGSTPIIWNKDVQGLTRKITIADLTGRDD